MRLKVFQSYEGDCLLVEGQQGRILCDGGRDGSMNRYVAPHLAGLDKIDLVYISHIDQDHIQGIEKLLDNGVEWLIYDHHQAAGTGNGIKQPKVPRVPKIGDLWHNAFRDQVGQNVGDIEDMLAASAPALLSTGVPELQLAGHEMAQIATSIPQAMRVSRMAGPQFLKIPLNRLQKTPTHSGKLLMQRPGQAAETFGNLHVTILSPTKEDLKELKEGWNNWLRTANGRAEVREIRREMARRLDEFSNGLRTNSPFELINWNGRPGYKSVTTPNVASLVLLVEENGKRVLLTGDSHPDMILRGLKKAGLMPNDYLHVDVVKFQHHGSEHNMSLEFGQKISADHYIFCGNGSSGNPEKEVLDDVFDSRVGNTPARCRTPEARADRPFTIWFNTHPAVQQDLEKRKHMEGLVAWAQQKEALSNGLMSTRFSQQDFFELGV